MNRVELVNAQQWMGYTIENWWMPSGVVRRIKIGPDIEEILYVLHSVWKKKDRSRVWEEIQKINANQIDMDHMENSIASLTCGQISLALGNLESAESNIKSALVHMPRSKAHHVAVISWLLGIVYWEHPSKHIEAINFWKTAIGLFTKIWRDGLTGMYEKEWYNRQLQVMRRVLRLAIREDQLPPLDSVPGAAPPAHPPLLFAAAKNGPFLAEHEEDDEEDPRVVNLREEMNETLAEIKDLLSDITDPKPPALNIDLPNVGEYDSDQIEIAPELFPHATSSPQDFLRILAVYEKIAAGPEAAVQPTPLNPTGVDGLSIDDYVEVTQVRIGEAQYYVKHLQSGTKASAAFVSQSPHFILKVAGDSMNQAGIDNGDYVIVRAQPQGSSNDIVVVQIKDEDTKATLKRLKAETQDEIILRPETNNPDIDPDGFTFTKKEINDSDKVMILGVAIAVLKPMR